MQKACIFSTTKKQNPNLFRVVVAFNLFLYYIMFLSRIAMQRARIRREAYDMTYSVMENKAPT